ncbi:MAG: DNA polymerase I [Candidatus Omnitrophica bacterium]|nr:DNA polymerase I [Candidatus Omnitrophota bacterium]
MDSHTLYLVDGSSLCYRAFFAINLSSSKGFPTGAIYGFYNTLRKIQKKFDPRYLVVCFDVSRKTFRQEKFKEYKITRPPAPDHLKVQIPRIKELIGALGITLCEREGYEADDLIASLSRKNKTDKVVVITSDKDLYQLIDGDRVTVYDPVKDKMFDEKEFLSRFGFVPSAMVDYLSFAGDASDNIPGAKGVGKVTATKLIQDYGSVEEVFAHLGDLSVSLQKKLKGSKHDVVLSKELITLVAPEIDLTLDDFEIKQPQWALLREMFQEFEFKSFLKEISQPDPASSLNIKKQKGIPESVKEKIISCGECAFWCQDDIVYVWEEAATTIYEAEHTDLKDIFSRGDVKKITYDCKPFLNRIKSTQGLRGEWFDVKIAGYLAASHLGDFTLENLLHHFSNEFVGELSGWQYPGYIWRLYPVLKEKLSECDIVDLFFQVEMPLTAVLADIENWGIRIDKKFLKSFSGQVEEEIESLRKDIFSQVKGEFNLNSPQQLQKVLFEKLKLPPVKKTKTGYSTNEEVLLKLKKKHPVIPLILDYREHSKLYSTYLTPFLKQIEPNEGVIYAQFNQTGTQTGRLSSSSPNIQNLPARSKFAREFRKAFISSFKEGIILSCDYSQIELRVLAHFSQDQTLCSAFKNDLDIHTFTAALLFDRREDRVSPDQREIAKMVNFGIVYGMSGFRLAREMNMSFEEAEGFIANYFSRYPGVKDFIEKTYRQAEESGYVKTLLGRIRFLPDVKSSYRDVREFAHRQAVNTPIQGTAADIIKMAMIRIHKEVQTRRLHSKMIAQIHDELIFDVRFDEFDQIRDFTKTIMEKVVTLSVPLKVNLKRGANWGELEPV